MEIEIKMDSAYKEPKLLILTDKMSDEISAIIEKLSGKGPQLLAGFREERLELLEPEELLRVYAAAGKVFAVTNRGEYTLRLRLYELEDRLDRHHFVRISHSEIINLKKVKNFDLSFAGTICVHMADGAVTYVSRRYVSGIKQVLGI